MTHILSRRGALLAAATLVLGAAVAVLAAQAKRDFRDVLAPVQLAISVLVPFFGVLAVTGPRPPDSGRLAVTGPRLRDADRLSVTGPQPLDWDRRLGGRLLGAEGLAAGFALVGVLLAAIATALFCGSWPSASQVVLLVVGSVLVQLIAQSVGTACGLLVRRPLIAMAATIVVPMGVTVVLGAIDSGGGLVRWLTPYGNAQALLAGKPTAALAVVGLLWCVLPNAVGARQRRPALVGPRR